MPFRRITRLKSSDNAGKLKAGFFLLFTGFSIHIIFFEVIVLLLKLDPNYIGGLMFLGVTGLPELDLLTPLIMISLSPFFFITTNPLLFFLSELPWFLAGFLTGSVFGPQHDRSILFAPPIFIGTIVTLFLFLLFTLTGLGSLIPSIGILLISTVIFMLLIVLGQGILMLSLTMIIPALFGYLIGKRYTFRAVPPQVFLAQPDRQDSNQTLCRYLNYQNKCTISNKKDFFIPNVCNNKWNQVTCSFYIHKKKFSRSKQKPQLGDLIDEIQ
ncbi:MAG: hypothetical protein ACFFB2_03480 [Promethearchaeota archaeon]